MFACTGGRASMKRRIGRREDLDKLVDLLLSKYEADHEGFRTYLPEIAQQLESLRPRTVAGNNPFGLTNSERDRRHQDLRRVVEVLRDGGLSRAEAIHGLEICAALIEDDSLPAEVDYQTLTALLRTATGTSIGSARAAARLEIKEEPERKVARRLSLIRGATLNLSWDMHLISVDIKPEKARERRDALRFVGAAQDKVSDVALNHDAYLSDSGVHGDP
jgi:hypothetical protein